MVRFGRLVVASKNPDKVAEVEMTLSEMGLVGQVVRGLDWPEVEETEPTLEGNALLKARAVAAATGIAALADDTGLEVPALGGRPGVYSARYAGPEATYADNVAKLVEDMAGVTDRRAVFRTAVALVTPAGREWTAEGRLEGLILDRPRGRSGFGYDPVFEVEGRTLAEMSPAEKSSLSHRARALHALGEKLASS